MEAYLDHAATTPMRPEASAALAEASAAPCGNPSGAHARARARRRLLDDARDDLAEVLGCRPGEIVVTSGGTEADNLAVFGVYERLGGTMVCSAVEHPAVLEPVLARGGRTLAVDESGRVDPASLEEALDESVTLVSVMAANNETGVVQPIAEIVDQVRAHAPQAVIHCDAVQAITWMPTDEVLAEVDLISLSAHKFGGAPGVGALVVREGTTVAPQLLGGGQERDRRSGTPNVPGAVAMAAAARAAAEERAELTRRIAGLRNRLVDGLAAEIDGLHETGVTAGARSHKLAGSAHVCIGGVESEALLFLLDEAGVCASAASSCASGAMESSHVLTAMGIDPATAAGSLRLSLGWNTTDAEIDHVLEIVPAAVDQLRAGAAVRA